MDVPHPSVKGLPADIEQAEHPHDGKSVGLNRDLKNVFNVVHAEEQFALHIISETS